MKAVEKATNLTLSNSYRTGVLTFEKAIKQVPGSLSTQKELDKLCPLTHSFSEGVYVREIFIPKGILVVGKIHKHEHPNFLLQGKVVVLTEDGGREVLEAPKSMISKAGTKRVVLALEDTRWVTIHLNPTESRDLEELEDQIIAKTYEDFEEFQSLQNSEKQEEIT